ncbi:MAG: hypothetical protein IT243_00405 [Bacteroidia bacterium]|nr:hypothetical protein [Bacteroidia bacterium]
MKKSKELSLLFVLFFFYFSNILAKEPIKKHRDRLRFGYNVVETVEVYQVGATGSREYVRTDVYCREAGDDRCRASSIANSDPANELDVCNEVYASAEKAVAENILVEGDNEIEMGVASGTVSQTIQFVNTETQQSYYRTFSYVWITNSDGTIDSSLSISDPF